MALLRVPADDARSLAWSAEARVSPRRAKVKVTPSKTPVRSMSIVLRPELLNFSCTTVVARRDHLLVRSCTLLNL